jgi:carbonic anhydrase
VSERLEALLEANRAAATPIAGMPANPRRRLAILTCMDARIEPLSSLGLQLGEAHVIRNAGARVTPDVLRSLALSQHVLGTDAVLVLGHTRCGLHGATDEDLAEAVRRGGGDPEGLRFLPFDAVEEGVRESVASLAGAPALRPDTQVWGAVYDVDSGRVSEVAR